MQLFNTACLLHVLSLADLPNLAACNHCKPLYRKGISVSTAKLWCRLPQHSLYAACSLFEAQIQVNTTAGHYPDETLALQALMQAQKTRLVCCCLGGTCLIFHCGICAGHSMGGALASVAAGSHADTISTAFLMDPVDWDFASNRVSATYLTR